jgi:hypothetical protein
VDREHLEITVLEIATVSTNHVILKTVHVMRVDVNVGMRELPVVQVCDISLISTLTLKNKNVDAKFSAHNLFLE